MRIRQATVTDFDQVYVLLTQLWSDTKISRTKARRIFEDLLKDHHVDLTVAEDRKKVVGFSSCRWKSDLWTQGYTAHLDEIIIDENYRGHGTGKKLMSHVEQKMKKLGCNAIICESALKRKETHAFYKKAGWTKYGYAFYKFFRK